MLSNYFKLLYRNFFKNRLYSIINLAGLTIGLSCFIIIALYIRNELSYDTYNKNAGRIMLLQQFENSSGSGGKFAGDMKSFSGVENVVRLKQSAPLITCRENAFYESNFYFADSTVFSVFTFPLLQGDAAGALKENYGVVISEKMALKYFPNQNPLGKQMVYAGKYTLHVTGVFKDLPANSHISIDFMANYANANELMGWDVTNNYWAGSALTYLLLAPGIHPAQIEAGFADYVKKMNDANAAFVWKLHLIPLRDIYLDPPFSGSNPLMYVYIFSIVAILILALACFNFINLATARASSRAKEVGIRKVMGSSASQLRFQFIFETASFISLSALIALGIINISLPWFNQLTGKELSINVVYSFTGVACLMAGIIIISLLAGSYPAFILSAYRPSAVLKGDRVHGKGKAWLRKILVVTQFSVSMIMIVATLTVFNQLQFIKNKNLGYQRSQVMTIDLRDAPGNAKALFKQQVIKLAAVSGATIAYGLPGSSMLQGAKLISECVPAGARDASILRLTIDEDFLSTFDIKLKEGRMFDKSRPADKKVFLINEAAKKYFGWKDIKGKQTGYYTFINNPDNSYLEVPQKGEVIGVMSDYNQADLKTPIQPMIFSLDEGYEGALAIKIKPGDIREAVAGIQALWKTDFNRVPFEYAFMDDTFNNTYQSAIRTGQVFGLFAVLAILISCLGLLGLVAYAAERRSKEIGIRKILGAGIAQIVQLLSKDFITLIGVASLIAFPVAWFAMQKWLQDFAYRTEISWWIFLLAGAAATMIAMLTIGYQAIKAAVTNPVNSLRSE